MKKILFVAFAFALLSCTGGKEKTKEMLKFDNQQQRLSYAIGADHAHSISESGDPNFAKYDLNEIVKGFERGLEDKDAFDEPCQASLRGLFGDEGRAFNEAFLKEGCECLGRLSGVVFVGGWEKKGGLTELDRKYIVAGFSDGLHAADSLVSKQDQVELVQNFYEELNKKMGEKMISEAKSKPNTEMVEGMVIETLSEGKGISPTENDKVQANYILISSTGDTLESSFQYEMYTGRKVDPFSLTQVIKGWQIGMTHMKEGGKYHIYIPYNLAYGEQGAFNPQRNSYDIQPYESLKFYIELEKVVK